VREVKQEDYSHLLALGFVNNGTFGTYDGGDPPDG
jgi:hypothetical protein